MIIKIQAKKGEFCWNSSKCKPLQFILGLSWLFIPIAAMAITQAIIGA